MAGHSDELSREPLSDRRSVDSQRQLLNSAVVDPLSLHNALRELQTLLEESDNARADRAGPGGRIDLLAHDGNGGFLVVDSSPDDRSSISTFGAAVRCQLVGLVQELDAARDRIESLGGECSVIDVDEELGLCLMSCTPIAVTTALEACVADGLSVGLNEVTMEAVAPAWRVKAVGWPEVPVASLGHRQESSIGAGVRVGVIDGGFSPPSPPTPPRTDGWLDDIVGPTVPTVSLDTDNIAGIDAGAGHGTFVSGVVRQVAPACEISQYSALNASGFGSSWRLKNAIQAAVADGCTVINLSLGYEAPPGVDSPAITVCLSSLPTDVVVVAAAGNGGSPLPTLPSCHKRTVAVAALETDLTPASWTNHGPWIDVSCVGVGVVSTFVIGDEPANVSPRSSSFVAPNPTALWSGTSFAAPQVTGKIAELVATGVSPRDAHAALLEWARTTISVPHPSVGFRMRVL